MPWFYLPLKTGTTNPTAFVFPLGVSNSLEVTISWVKKNNEEQVRQTLA